MLNNGNSLGLPTFFKFFLFYFLKEKRRWGRCRMVFSPYVLLVHPIYQTVVLKTTITSLVVLRCLKNFWGDKNIVLKNSNEARSTALSVVGKKPKPKMNNSNKNHICSVT